MRTVTPIQFIDKTDNQKTDTRTMGIDTRTTGMDFKTSNVDTNTTNTMITRILAKHHMEFTAKNIGKFAHLQDNRMSNSINYTKEQIIKKYIFVNNRLYQRNLTVLLKFLCVR